jgi:glycosyltransferase involved in cell wall biosynthesis
VISAKTASDFPSVLFIALDTYSAIGGLQLFNRRVIANLAALAAQRGAPKPFICCMGDQASDFPSDIAVEFRGHGRSRLGFIVESLKQSAHADTLLVGHINLMPVAWLSKWLRPKLRVALFVHGDEVWNCHLRPRKWYERYLLRCVDRVAAVSEFTANVMGREYRLPPSKFQVFPNAVDCVTDPSTAPDRQTDLVLTVSRLGPGDRMKNIDVLIKAVALLARDGVAVRLEIIGDGLLRSALERLAKHLGVESRVSFLGRVDDVDLANAYARASVFALASSKEGFGIVYLEAWQRQLPVVCGTLGASHEVVSDGIDGFVADEADPADVAAKIRRLITVPSLARSLGRNGYEKVQNTYLNTHARARLFDLITDLARSNLSP